MQTRTTLSAASPPSYEAWLTARRIARELDRILDTAGSHRAAVERAAAELRLSTRQVYNLLARYPETREFRPVARRDGRLAPMTLWEHRDERARRRAANARSASEKVALQRRIAEIVGGSKPAKAVLRDAVRRTHAAEAGKPHEALRRSEPEAPAAPPVRERRRLPVEDW